MCLQNTEPLLGEYQQELERVRWEIQLREQELHGLYLVEDSLKRFMYDVKNS